MTTRPQDRLGLCAVAVLCLLAVAMAVTAVFSGPRVARNSAVIVAGR